MDQIQTYHVGDIAVTRVQETPLEAITPEYLFPDWESSFRENSQEWLVPGMMDPSRTHLLQSVHTWVIRTRRHTILIDTATGNDRERNWSPRFHHLNTPYMERLAAAGVNPEKVDYVILTHIHLDHVGWNTQRIGNAWIPTFPNATYIFPKAEQCYWSDLKNYPGENRVKFVIYEDSVQPVIDAGLAELIDPAGQEYLPGISLHPVPGHTPGQMAVGLVSGNKTALFGGDIMHHPIQVYRPEWNSVHCLDPEEARASRTWALGYVADRDALYFSSHFGGPSAGRVTRTGSSFRWEFC